MRSSGELLHLVFSSPGLEACLARRGPDEPLVLMVPTVVLPYAGETAVYRLSLDGSITDEQAIRTLSPMDLVVLTELYPKNLSWS